MKQLLFSGLMLLMALSVMFPAQIRAQANASINVQILVHPEAIAPAQVSAAFSIESKKSDISEHTRDAFLFHEDTSVSVAMTKTDASSESDGQMSMLSVNNPDDLGNLLNDFCREKVCIGDDCQQPQCLKQSDTAQNEQYKVVLVYN